MGQAPLKHYNVMVGAAAAGQVPALRSPVPQAAFANWCKRVLQTELLISPQKSTLTASGGVHGQLLLLFL